MSDIVNAINMYYHHKSLAETFDEMSDYAVEAGDDKEAERLVRESIKYAKYALDVREIIVDRFKSELEDN